VVEGGVDVVIASDPQGIKHGSNGCYIDSGAGRAALAVVGITVSVAKIFRDLEFVEARLNGNIHVVSCYVSSNPGIPHFQDFLQCLENYIRSLPAEARIVIAGDFNARSAA